MKLKELLKIAAVGTGIFSGFAGLMIGGTKLYNESTEMKYVNQYGIYATESVGIQGTIILDWQEGSGAWLHYSDNGNTSHNRDYFADNPLGENIKVICDDFSCVETGENGFDKKLESAKQDWAEFCEEIDCKGLYAESQSLREYYGGK